MNPPDLGLGGGVELGGGVHGAPPVEGEEELGISVEERPVMIARDETEFRS